MQVADALAHAAGQGVLHRDIKPSNLLLDETGNVWVTDFGLAKADDDGNLTHTGDIVGTLRYMAPERFNGQGDLRSDVYSLGLTLYELLTLQTAFDETDRNKLVKQVMHDEPVGPRKINRAVPRDLETVVLKAIARDPAHRYQTPADMADDLKRFVEDRPVQARRISSIERLARWGKRNPLVAGSLTGVVAVFLTAFVLVSWSYFRAEDARQEEANQRQKAEHREKAERWERYRANMIAAGSAMQLHNVSAARAALDAAPEEHRNWEWKYFSHQLDTAHTVVRVGEGIQVMEIAPDGTTAAVQSANMPACFWDLKTRQVTATLPNRSSVTKFEFSSDGKTLACAVADNHNIYLWDIAASRKGPVLSGCEKHVSDLHFRPDGAWLVAACKDRTVRIWDTTTGKPLRVLRGHQNEVHNAVFSPDGRRILSAGLHDGTARLWDAETGQSLPILGEHEGEVANAIFNPQGDRVLTVELYPGNALRLWNATTGKLVDVLRGHTNSAGEIAFSPDGTTIASGGLDWAVRLWDGRTGQPLARLDGHRGHIRALAFSPDGKLLISAAADRTARLWDAKSGAALGVLTGHTGDCSVAQFTPDGRTIVTASSADGTVRLWDARRAEQNGALRRHTSFVYDVAFHPDGERVASASWDGTVRIWDATTGRAVSLHDLSTLPAEEKILSGIAFHPGGNLAATCGRKDGVRLWDLTTRNQLHHFGSPTFYDSQLTFSTRGDLLVSGTAVGVHVWDVKRRTPVAVLRGHNAHSAAFNPDDTWLALGEADRNIRIWDVAKQRPIQVLAGHTDLVPAVTVSRDGKWLAPGSMDGTARVWDTTAWTEAAAPLKHGTTVYGVAFSPDGTRLACACGNGMIRLWDMKTFQFVADLEGHTDYVHKVAFSPDGTRLVSCSGDKTVRIWDSLSASERAGRRLAAQP
jgi:WD40 repeat protein